MKIGVVLVTYNRLEKLKIALKSYEEQTVLPKYILVVNNNSNDGTRNEDNGKTVFSILVSTRIKKQISISK